MALSRTPKDSDTAAPESEGSPVCVMSFNANDPSGAAGLAADVAAIDAAWRTILGRFPTPSERKAALEHVAAERAAGGDREGVAWSSLCQVLFNTNEFITVD